MPHANVAHLRELGKTQNAGYLQQGYVRSRLPGVPVMALTATAAAQVQEDIVQQLRLRDPLWLVSSFDRPNIDYSVRIVECLPHEVSPHKLGNPFYPAVSAFTCCWSAASTGWTSSHSVQTVQCPPHEGGRLQLGEHSFLPVLCAYTLYWSATATGRTSTAAVVLWSALPTRSGCLVPWQRS